LIFQLRDKGILSLSENTGQTERISKKRFSASDFPLINEAYGQYFILCVIEAGSVTAVFNLGAHGFHGL